MECFSIFKKTDNESFAGLVQNGIAAVIENPKNN
jgi:hypothetical protein